jgi:hypothetical protein
MLFELPGGEGGFAQRAQALQQLAGQLGWEGLQALPQERQSGPAELAQRLQACRPCWLQAARG